MASRIVSLVVAGLCVTTSPMRAQQHNDDVAVAMGYLTTLYSFDFDRLEEMLATDAIMRDPTAVALRGRPLHYVGRDTILSSFRAGAASTRNAGFEVERHFSTGGYVTVTLIYHTEINGDAVGIPDRWIPIRVPGVTVIRVADGKVKEHIDYVDYDELLRQIATERDRNRSTSR